MPTSFAGLKSRPQQSPVPMLNLCHLPRGLQPGQQAAALPAFGMLHLFLQTSEGCQEHSHTATSLVLHLRARCVAANVVCTANPCLARLMAHLWVRAGRRGLPVALRPVYLAVLWRGRLRALLPCSAGCRQPQHLAQLRVGRRRARLRGVQVAAAGPRRPPHIQDVLLQPRVLLLQAQS